MNTYVGMPDHTYAQLTLSVIDPCPTQVVTPVAGPVIIELPASGPGEQSVFLTNDDALALFILSEPSNT
jgi:hypothetical protein